MRVAFVGGCFPVQHNIAPERLYYQTTLADLRRAGVAAEAVVVRYERLGTCLARVEAALRPRPGDAVVLHLRTEPVMRFARLVYKYYDADGRLRRALNAPGSLWTAAEAHDVLTSRPREAGEAPRSRRPVWAHEALVAANYALGRAVGNEAGGRRRYVRLVAQAEAFARSRALRLVVVGPVSRPRRASEDRMSDRLDAAFARALPARGTAYVPALGYADDAGRPLHFPNGIHVSQAGHDRLGARIADALLALG